jgi:truncated hemoglobin YjbI
VFAAHGAAITDQFYQRLAANPEQARMIEGRVDALKRTHNRWMSELFAGTTRRPTSRTAGGSA